MDNPFRFKLVLASGSPRRQQFLRDMNLSFEIRVREIEEVYPPELRAGEITDYLARLKSDAFNGLAADELLITSDTIVWLEGAALGKPRDAADALRMLRLLSGKTHEVITSVCFKSVHACEILRETTQVTFGKLTDDMIEYYLREYKPFDKAGAYGIQDWIGLVGIARIDGSYTNVVGLPTEKFFFKLQEINKI